MHLAQQVRPYHTGVEDEANFVYPGDWRHNIVEAAILNRINQTILPETAIPATNKESTALRFQTKEQAAIACTTLEYFSFGSWLTLSIPGVLEGLVKRIDNNIRTQTAK